MVRRIVQTVALLWGAGIVALSIVPAELRPVIIDVQIIEHIGVFLLLGIAFGLAFRGARSRQLAALVVFAGVLEVVQLWVPGRHARLSDFAVNAVAGCCGIAVAMVASKIRASYGSQDSTGCAKIAVLGWMCLGILRLVEPA